MTRRVTGMAWLGVGLGLLLGGEPARADRLPLHDKAESLVYPEKARGMLWRGLLNVGTGYVDILTRTMDETMIGPPFVGTLRGLTYGTGCAVVRTASGLLDWATFWVPGFNGAPASADYHNCLRE